MNVEDVPMPVPGPGEVVLKVHSVSVNRGLDLMVRAGRYLRRPALPHVLGADPSGVVVAVGPDVTNRKLGDRVACGPVVGIGPHGLPLMLGVDAWGGYAEHLKVPARITSLLPDGLDFHTATLVARHAPLAFTQLRDRAQVKPGEWVLVMGAAGGLGSIAVQAAKYLGARVIAAAGSQERVEAALALGADAGVDYRSQDLAAEVRKITDGAGANVVLENIGDPDLFAAAFASIARGGRLITAGGHGGNGIVPLDVRRLYLNFITIIGDPRDNPDTLELALKAAADGQLKVLIDQVMPLSRAVEAHEIAEKRAGLGKIVLDPAL